MFICDKATLYLKLALRGDWREINRRLQLLVGRIDLQNVYVDELRLSDERSFYYSNSGGEELETILDECRIGAADAIIDFGCGKGGALVSMAKFPFRRITGVDISSELIEIAKRNLRRLWIRNVELRVSDAAAFQDLADYNYVYFFNPFPAVVLAEVMENICRSVERKPRLVTIIYLNPICHDTVMAKTPFTVVREREQYSLPCFIYQNRP